MKEDESQYSLAKGEKDEQADLDRGVVRRVGGRKEANEELRVDRSGCRLDKQADLTWVNLVGSVDDLRSGRGDEHACASRDVSCAGRGGKKSKEGDKEIKGDGKEESSSPLSRISFMNEVTARFAFSSGKFCGESKIKTILWW